MGETMLSDGRNEGLPQYLLIAETIRGWVRTGRYRVGDSIATIDELAKEFGVAKGTVQEALRHLSRDDIIISSRGRPARVGSVPSIRPVFSEIDVRDRLLIERVGQKANRLISSRVIAPPPDLSQRLGLPEDCRLIELTLILYLNDEPNTYAIVYLDGGTAEAEKEAPDLATANAMIEELIVQADRAERRVAATTADLEIASYLPLHVGAPVLRFSVAMWDRNKSFLIYIVDFLRSDGREYNIDA